MKNGKDKDSTIVTCIGDFEDTLIWMSGRFWMTSNSDILEPPPINFAEKVTGRYWGGLTPLQIEKMSVDINREKNLGWGNMERINILADLHNRLKYKEIAFHPYKKCDDIEFTLIRMAILYACGRQTIASATLPADIIENRYEFLSEEQKQTIVSDLQKYLERLKDSNIRPIFGNVIIDNNVWMKFMTALDSTKHEIVKHVTGVEIVAFRTVGMRGNWNHDKHMNEFVEEEMVYPLECYIKEPYREIFIPKESIIENEYQNQH